MIQVASSHDRGMSAMASFEERDLKWIASAFESAQAQRIRTGEEIRAQIKSSPDGNRSVSAFSPGM